MTPRPPSPITTPAFATVSAVCEVCVCTMVNAAVQVPAVAASHNQQPQASAGGRPAALLRHGCCMAVQVREKGVWGEFPQALELQRAAFYFASSRPQVSGNAHVLLQRCRRHVASAWPPQLLHVHPAAGAFGTLKEQEPLGLGGWFVSDDHTSVQWSRRANEPQQQIGEPYLLSVDIYDIINAIGEWLVRTGASTSTLMVDTW